MTTPSKPKTLPPAGEQLTYPVLPLRDIVVFPHMIVPLFVGREKSVKALKEVMRDDKHILVVTQKNAQDDDPSPDQIYATGAIALLRPLIDAGLLDPDSALVLPAVSGYSGGGRSLIEAHEAGTAPLFEAYALGLTHKHLPEIMKFGRLTRRPIFIPTVGNFRQGMLVELPLHLDTLPGKPTAQALEDALTRHYAASEWVSVEPATPDGKLDALALNNTNKLELRVYGNETLRQAVLIARLDNLGKGASGAAVQNLKLMLNL